MLLSHSNLVRLWLLVPNKKQRIITDNYKTKHKGVTSVQVWVFMPIILATGRVEIRRIMLQDQTGHYCEAHLNWAWWHTQVLE
jgi:hypothetical protein